MTAKPEQVFFVPGPLPGLNEIIAAGKQIIPWLSKGKRRVYELTILKKEWDEKVSMAVSMAAMLHRIKPMESVDIRLVWIELNRRRDKDNVMAGKKFILDGLVKAGILKNDGWKQVGRFTEDVILGENAGVIVALIEREDIA